MKTSHLYKTVLFIPITSFILLRTQAQPLPTLEPISPENVNRVVVLASVSEEISGFSDGFAWSPDGKMLAITTPNGIILYDAKALLQPSRLLETDHPVQRLAFSPDSSILIATNYSYRSGSGNLLRISAPTRKARCCLVQEMRLWDLNTNKSHIIITYPPEAYYSLAFSPNGLMLAAAYNVMGVYRIEVFETNFQDSIKEFSGHTDSIWKVVYSPDSIILASASYDKDIRLWDTATGEPKAILQGHSEAVRSIAFNRDGTILASASLDGTVRLWDIVDGSTLQVLKGKMAGVTSVAFSPDSSLIAAGCEDGEIHFWDTSSNIDIASLKGYMSSIVNLAFNKDGTVLASYGEFGSVRLWGVPHKS